MPVTKTTSILGALADRARKAVAEIINEPFNPGQLDLPPGINDGIAQLNICRIAPIEAGKPNAGKLRFYADAIAKTPEALKGRPVAGLRTKIFEDLFDTPEKRGNGAKTFEEHSKIVANHLKGLGVPKAIIADPERWPDACAAAAKKRPHIRFSTRSGQVTEIEQRDGKWCVVIDGKVDKTVATEEMAKKLAPYAGREPMVFHSWHGPAAAPFVVADPAAAIGKDSSAPSANGAGASHEEPPADSLDAEQPEAEVAIDENGDDVAAGEAGVPVADEIDWDAVAEAAEAKDGDAQRQLEQAALAAGATQDEVDGAPNWAAVVEMIRSGTPVDPDSVPEPEPEPFVPVKGAHYAYKPINPKTKKPAEAAVMCQVLVVNKAKKMVQLRNVKNPKVTYDAVGWDDLIVE